MSCDVLNLEWASAGRDREVASAICHTLRRRGYSVVEGSVFNCRYLLHRHRPRLLYLADPVGAHVNYQAILYADRIGIPVVTVDAEGNYREGALERMLWGHVADREMRERLKLMWSTRARDLAIGAAPELADRLKVSGAVGFDRYRLLRFAAQDDWRRRYGFEQQRVAGFAAWSFNAVFAPEATVRERIDLYGEETVERFRCDRDALRELLAEVIERRFDTMFVLREHPSATGSPDTEIAGLERYDNVLKVSTEETIGDTINACDVWMAYESTTCIEAWLLGKPTLFVNPSGGDFPRANVHEGTPVVTTAGEVDAALLEHARSGRIESFDALATKREEVLTDTLQWTDGRNHVRAAHLIAELLDGLPPARPDVRLRDRVAGQRDDLMLRGSRYLGSLPGFGHRKRARARFDPDQAEQVRRRIAAPTAGLDATLSPHEVTELEWINR